MVGASDRKVEGRRSVVGRVNSTAFSLNWRSSSVVGVDIFLGLFVLRASGLLLKWQRTEITAEKLIFGTGLVGRGLDLVGEWVDEKRRAKEEESLFGMGEGDL